MKNLLFSLFLLFNFLSPACFAENVIEISKTYSRGDDDLAYTYETARMIPSLKLERVRGGFEASISLTSILSTAQAQGFAESVRFGMRESQRFFRPMAGHVFAPSAVNREQVFLKFDSHPQLQRLGEQLSSTSLRSGQGIAGNRPEAMGQSLHGTLALGRLTEGSWQGVVFVQQLVGQAISQQDTDISVRHLLLWEVTIEDGNIEVEVQNGRYYAAQIGLDIGAPSWARSGQRPHRVKLLSDLISIDGQSVLSGLARFEQPYPSKQSTPSRDEQGGLNQMAQNGGTDNGRETRNAQAQGSSQAEPSGRPQPEPRQGLFSRLREKRRALRGQD